MFETDDPKLLKLAKLMAEQSVERLQADDLACDANVFHAKKVVIKDGKKYIKVDQGDSGKYMIVKETGEIFGIKAYGVIHRGHQFGTLDTIDQWNWGGYRAVMVN